MKRKLVKTPRTRGTLKRAQTSVTAKGTAGDGVGGIQHVIVLMLENRSFDQMLGSLKSLYPEMEGVDPGKPGVNYDGATAYPQQANAVFQLPYGVDPMHELTDVTEQLSGGCGGFI